MNVSCVINAHREAHVVYPTLRSVRGAVELARRCGLEVDVHAVLDRPDSRTRNIVEREMAGFGHVHVVDEGDLSESRNHAVERCEGDHIAFIDGDDLWGRRWLVDAYLAAENERRPSVFHPEFNVYFGSSSSDVFHHVDMESPDFDVELLLRENYWTALSFARREIYRRHPYRRNRIADGFGYEDWTWNHETATAGILHKVVPGSAHYIRRGKLTESLLVLTGRMKAIPTVLDMYGRASSAAPAPPRTIEV